MQVVDEIRELLSSVAARLALTATMTNQSDVQENIRLSAEAVASIDKKFNLLVETSRTSLDDRLIMKAKHLLMQRWNWSEDRAFKHIQRTAKSQRIKMTELAAQVIKELTEG